MSGPLSHIRVLDLSRVLAGPWAGQNLADLGAEVIKVERPGTGDDTRAWGPPFLNDRDGEPTRESAYYLATNRGKRSIAIDIASRSGADLVRKLAAKSDIVLENYKVGGLAGYGLDYESLKKVNPRLVYCSITGFGQTGPYRERPGYDFVIQAMGGMMSITGERDERAGGGPQKVGVAIADIMTGMYASVAVLAALAHRDRTGEGQHIDLALLDCLVASLASQNMNYLVSGGVPGRLGNEHANIVPYQVFDAADGRIVVAVGNDGQFARFCDIAGCPELAVDERFATNRGRVENRERLIPMIAEILRTRSARDWLDGLEEAGIPCGPVNDLAAVFEDPQIRHRELKRELRHPLADVAPQVVSPMRFSSSQHVYKDASPLLGQHTDEVLGGILGLDPGQIQELRAAGVVG
ncbi:MAG: CaiB/BaiF CoA transferase family protein [Sphingomonadales bacterium]